MSTAAAPVAMQNRQGDIAQLFEVQSLAVNGPLTVAGNATGNFTASALLDDATTFAPALLLWNQKPLTAPGPLPTQPIALAT